MVSIVNKQRNDSKKKTINIHSMPKILGLHNLLGAITVARIISTSELLLKNFRSRTDKSLLEISDPPPPTMNFHYSRQRRRNPYNYFQ